MKAKMKRMHFSLKNIILTIMTIASILCVIKWSNIPAWNLLPALLKKMLEHPYEGTITYEIWALLNNLSLAYIASIIFYIVIEYIPKKEKEKKAFLIISKDLENIYNNLSYIIRVVLFEIGLEKEIDNIELSDLSKVRFLDFDTRTKYADITHIRNNKDINVKDFSYNLLDKCKSCGMSITQSIDTIFSLQVSGNINDELIYLLSSLRKCRFLHMMSLFDYQNTRRIPGCKKEILYYDKSFLELINYRKELELFKKKNVFDLLDYHFAEMTYEQICKEREKRIYWLNRGFFMQGSIEKIQNNLTYMHSIVINESNFHKLNGVLMEALVTYDIDNKQYGYMLPIAKNIAKYLCQYKGSEECSDISCLNYLQVIRRMGTITKKNLREAHAIIANPNKPNHIRLGALIIVKKFNEARNLFDTLDDKTKQQLICSPIYRLWQDPPIPPVFEQPSFNVYD